MNKQPVGVFDSGIGGLTVLREIFRELPGEGALYLGDTARVPYGIRSAETVARYSFESTDFLVGKGIKLLVVACNTVSAVSLEEIKTRLSIPVIGVIEPGAKAAVAATKNKRVAVVGTEATINSGAYYRTIKTLDSEIDVTSLSCPLFVPLAEEGLTDDDIALLVTEKYLGKLRNIGIDTLVLGCTHYPLLKGVIAKIMGDKVTLVDSAIETVREIKEVLTRYDMYNNSTPEPSRLFYVTDSPERFVKVGERFLKQKIKNIEKISIGQ